MASFVISAGHSSSLHNLCGVLQMLHVSRELFIERHSQTLYAFYLILAINPFPAVIYDDFLPECPRIYFYFEDLQNHPVSSPNRAMLHAGAGRSQPSCNEGVLQHKR